MTASGAAGSAEIGAPCELARGLVLVRDLSRPPIKGGFRSSPLSGGLMRQAGEADRAVDPEPTFRHRARSGSSAMTVQNGRIQLIALNNPAASPRSVRQLDRIDLRRIDTYADTPDRSGGICLRSA